mmetsp:Transcript_17919/g.69427  ORF Transcript_17919/g.69427 Transcript_17919/m.69427 type:complete len:209 (-) Transcript_17919:171-797(-)
MKLFGTTHPTVTFMRSTATLTIARTPAPSWSRRKTASELCTTRLFTGSTQMRHSRRWPRAHASSSISACWAPPSTPKLVMWWSSISETTRGLTSPFTLTACCTQRTPKAHATPTAPSPLATSFRRARRTPTFGLFLPVPALALEMHLRASGCTTVTWTSRLTPTLASWEPWSSRRRAWLGPTAGPRTWTANCSLSLTFSTRISPRTSP